MNASISHKISANGEKFPTLEVTPLSRGSPIFGHAALVLLHGGGRGHAVEQLPLLAVLLDDLAARLVVTGQHSAQHDKVGSSANGFGNVARAGAAAILKNPTSNECSITL